ncbi:Bug family tripartite tricarboxylate transporter substrate binding protein [Roseitranquillus sediminis]|uniref:Bug family tripartite tricarboxylate transporter substrate binding protein n=1 Tax=Roseitranquillus sediminis TaxID=2809051 RepID=UPI001D0CAAAE|nr:tripartite tricarboxylate transporter substrate binding protein [Roseitranquillus sediminis]
MIGMTGKAWSLIKAGAMAGVVAAPLALPQQAAAQEDYPSEQLEWTIAFGPGGGNDIMSRTIVDILQKYDIYPAEIAVENRAGGSGAVGWGYLYSQAGNPYAISTTSGSYITTPLQADTPWGPSDFTPVALLASDDLVLLVNGDSEIDSFEEFIESARENPPTIGGIGTINVDFIVAKILSDQADFDFDYVSFNDAGEMNTALLSDALDAMMANPAEILGLVESGDMKALAFSGDTPPSALGDVPTMAESGYEIGVSLPRGLILAPDVSEEAQNWWIEAMKQVVETEEWKNYIETNQLTENIQYGDEFEETILSTQENFETILREQGVID